MMNIGRKILLIALLAVAPVAILAPGVAFAAGNAALKAFSGFQSGRWQVSKIDGSVSSVHCIGSVDAMLAAKPAAGSCAFTIITNETDAAVVTYRCDSGRSGRTVIRRDMAGLYRVDAQGVENNRPFAERTEWRRTGAC